MQPECTNRNNALRTSSHGRASAEHFPPSELYRVRAGRAIAADAQFRCDVMAGLSLRRKELHCKYFYDERGSQLFDQICELDEYYPTRVETQIMQTHANSISKCIGPHAVILEYGSGSSTKTRILLDNLQLPHAYLPVDISQDHLLKTSEQLRADYPTLEVQPIIADFTEEFEIPTRLASQPMTVYFPGSTIGNLEQQAAVLLLKQIAGQCGQRGGLLIGVDLYKSPEILHRAYNDRYGVTAEFNLNLLHRINRELDADFVVSQFEHMAIVNSDKTRVEIYIKSLKHQVVRIGDDRIEFQKGELILTEYSHKYQLRQFSLLARQAGFRVNDTWTDDDQYFAVLHCVLQ